jgi:hypothetical protein
MAVAFIELVGRDRADRLAPCGGVLDPLVDDAAGDEERFLQALDFECLLARNVGPSERETPA